MLTFQQEINDRINFLTKTSRDRKKTCEDFIYMLNEKADIEEVYSENLLKFNGTIKNLVENSDNMLEACFSSFQSFQTINYHQTIEIVGSIRNEIIPTMKKLLNGQVTTQSKTSMEIRAESKKLLEQFEKLTKLKDKVWEHKQDSKIEHPNSERVLNETAENFKKSMDDYLQNIENANQYFYDQDNKRLEMMKDSLRKYFIYEISRIRNLQYDSEKITKKLETISLENDNIFTKNQDMAEMNETTKISFEKFSNFVIQSLSNPLNETPNFSKQKNEINEGFTDAWKNILDKWNNYKSKNVNFFSINNKNVTFSFFDSYFNNALRACNNTEEDNQHMHNLLKDPPSQEIFCHFLESYKQILRNPLNQSQFDGLFKTLLQIMTQLIEQNQIETLKKTILFSKNFYKMKKTFEMKNQSVIPKQEEKYFIFSELKTKLSYTQNEYWVKETKSRLNIILEKYNNFIAENSEDKDNELYIESFKSLILNQLRHVSKEMNFISFSKQVIGEIFKHAKQTINEKENKEFALIVNNIILESFNIETNNKENQNALISNKKKIFEEASKKTLSINLLDEGLKLKSERKNEKKEILDLLNL